MDSKFPSSSRFGSYTLIELYPTQGRSGQVWKAEDSLGNPVVIKAPDFAELPATLAKQRKEITREIEILEKLRDFSPPVVALLFKDIVQHAGEYYPFAVLEQLNDAENLYNIIWNDYQKYRVVPVLEMLDVYWWMLRVLEHAHQSGIVYNDVDLKHIFWSRALNKGLLLKEEQRIRVIDWANSFYSSSLKDVLADLRQAGELLNDIFTIARTKPMEATQNYTPSIRRILNEISSGVYSTPNELLSATDKLRVELRHIFYTSLKEIDSQIRKAIDADLNQFSGLLEKARALSREFHHCDHLYWQMWDSWHELAIERAVIQIEKLTKRGQHSLAEQFLLFIQAQINQLTELYSETSRDAFVRLADYVILSSRVIRAMRDTEETANIEGAIAAITATWKQLLPNVHQVEPRLILHEMLLQADGVEFETWRALGRAAFLFAYIYDIPETAWPVDLWLIRALLKNDPSGDLEDETTYKTILEFHQQVLLGNPLLPMLETFLNEHFAQEQCIPVFQALTSKVHKAVEQLPMTVSLLPELDYWHRSHYILTCELFSKLGQQLSHLRRFHYYDETSHLWHEVHTVNTFKLWVETYILTVNEWSKQGKSIFEISTSLSEVQSSFERFVDALANANFEQARMYYSKLANHLDNVSSRGRDWLNSKLSESDLFVQSVEMLIRVWQSEFVQEQSFLQHLCLHILNTEVTVSDDDEFDLDRGSRKALEQDFEGLSAYIGQRIDEEPLRALLESLSDVLTHVLDPITYSLRIDSSVWDHIPRSTFKHTAKIYFRIRGWGKLLGEVSTSRKAEELYTQFSSIVVDNDSTLSTGQKRACSILQIIVEAEKQWQHGYYSDSERLLDLSKRLENTTKFINSPLLDLVKELYENFKEANQIIEDLRHLRRPLLTWLENKYYEPTTKSKQALNNVSSISIVVEITKKYDRIMELQHHTHSGNRQVLIWQHALESHVEIAISKQRRNLPQLTANDPLAEAYIQFRERITQKKESQNDPVALVFGIFAVILLVTLVFVFTRLYGGSKTLSPAPTITLHSPAATRNLSSIQAETDATELHTSEPRSPTVNVLGEIIEDAELIRVQPEEFLESAYVRQGTMLVILGIDTDDAQYMVEYEGAVFWVSTNSIAVSRMAQTVIPTIRYQPLPEPTQPSTLVVSRTPSVSPIETSTLRETEASTTDFDDGS